MTESEAAAFYAFIEDFCQNVEQHFSQRMDLSKPDLYDKHILEVAGGLLARQCTLAIQLAKSPSIWNGHAAPLFLRCMTDGYITLGWILEDPQARATMYVKYGLGQEKLFVEYLEEGIRSETDPRQIQYLQQMIDVRKNWLNGQWAIWATDVNVGAWSGINTREMAQAIGKESIYKFAYVPFSGVAHNMWQHIGLYNVVPCTNPLHHGHLIPSIRKVPIDIDYLRLAAKYVTQTLELFDQKRGTVVNLPLPLDYLLDHSYLGSLPEDSDDS